MDAQQIIESKWYTLDQPWAHSEQAGLVILAGSPDPHVAPVVADCGDPLIDGEIEQHELCAIASHIVELHNASLTPTGEDG